MSLHWPKPWTWDSPAVGIRSGVRLLSSREKLSPSLILVGPGSTHLASFALYSPELCCSIKRHKERERGVKCLSHYAWVERLPNFKEATSYSRMRGHGLWVGTHCFWGQPPYIGNCPQKPVTSGRPTLLELGKWWISKFGIWSLGKRRAGDLLPCFCTAGRWQLQAGWRTYTLGTFFQV